MTGPLAARILADDTDEQLEQEPLLPAWCATRGIECVRMLGWTLRLSHSRRNSRTRKGRGIRSCAKREIIG